MIKGDLLIISPSFIDDLDNIFYEEYNTKYAKSCSQAIIFLEKNQCEPNVILLNIIFSIEEESSFLNFMQSNQRYNNIPILLFTEETHIPMDKAMFDKGIVDCIYRPYNKKVHLNRIANAIELKDKFSYNQMENILKNLPATIFFKDINGRYVFASHYWYHLKGYDQPEWNIKGKTDLEIRQDSVNAIKAHDEDMKIINKGIGSSYIINTGLKDKEEYLSICKEPVFDDNGNVIGIIGLINDVTEQELIRKELEKKANYDDMTGIYNKDYFIEYIETIKDEDYPLAVISADCDCLKKVNDNFGHQAGDEYIKMTVMLFKLIIQDNGILFRTGGDEFIIIINNAKESDVQKYIQKMEAKSKVFNVRGQKLSVSFGYAFSKDNSINIKDLIKISDDEMYVNKKRKKEEGEI